MWILFRDVCADLWLRTSGREALEGNVCARRVRETDVGWSGRMGARVRVRGASTAVVTDLREDV